MENEAASVLVLGIGNPGRGDDAAGPLTAERLKAQNQPGVEVRIHAGEAAGLIDFWAGRRAVIVVDAVVTGAAAGTLHRWDAAAGSIAVDFRTASSHAFGLGPAIELARALGRLPQKLIVYGIEGEQFGLGEPPGEAVLEAVEKTVMAIAREMSYINNQDRK